MSKPINRSPSPQSGFQRAGSWSASYRSQHGEQTIRSIVEESLARDLDDEDFEDDVNDHDWENVLSRVSTRDLGEHSLVGNGRRPSFIASGPRPFLGVQLSEPPVISTEQDREAAIEEERSLLWDNNLLPARPSRRRESQASSTSTPGALRNVLSTITNRKNDEEPAAFHTSPAETTPLLNDTPEAPPDNDPEDPKTITQKWEEAILTGQIKTTPQRESLVLASSALPLIATFLLQQSLTLTSIFIVGHIGKTELGAVSLGGMTATITGYAVYQGLATSLDTLCAQAYGSGRKKLVGLNLQRMVFFLWCCTVPIALVWFFAEAILRAIVPEEEQEIAVLAGRYLRVLILGTPAYACFESGKRYVQAQGRFVANMYVLLIAALGNVVLHWLFVWHFNWGFIGCPIAIVVTENAMPVLLALYVRYIGGLECWPGLSRKAFTNWGPMIRLALPGFIMIIAEFLAFEILTLASARIDATHLAANTILQSVSVAMYSLPFPLSIVGSTRVANLIGAGLPEAAKVTARVLFTLGGVLGVLNMVVLSLARFHVPKLFTRDEDVVALAAATLPINAAFQLFDALAAQCNGVLRGIGKQSVGGIISLVAFYGIALPISFGTGFGLDWKLKGLWTGPAVALFVQASLEGSFIYYTSWQKASEEAASRNAAG